MEVWVGRAASFLELVEIEAADWKGTMVVGFAAVVMRESEIFC